MIGPARNLAAGLEESYREPGRDPILSDAFARLCAAAYRLLAEYRLPGIGRPVEAFAAFERA